MASTGLSHVELTVRDLDRSLHFYRDLLGLQVMQEGTERDLPDSQDYQGIFEQPNRKFRFVVLHYNAESAGRMGWGREHPSLSCLRHKIYRPRARALRLIR